MNDGVDSQKFKQNVAEPMLDEDQIIRQTDFLAETIINVIERRQQREQYWGKVDWSVDWNNLKQ